LFFFSGKPSKGHTLTHYLNYSHSPITGVCGVSHSSICNLTDEHVMKFLDSNSQQKKVKRHWIEVSLEAIYCKQCIKNNYHNLYSFAGLGNLLLTQISTELKAVIVVAINKKNNQVIV